MLIVKWKKIMCIFNCFKYKIWDRYECMFRLFIIIKLNKLMCNFRCKSRKIILRVFNKKIMKY